jgi:NAD-dependent SIR2 family protein deacetylase
MKAISEHCGASIGESRCCEPVTCSGCGREVKSLQEWIKGGNNVILCESCYGSLLYPNINEHLMEYFD